MQWGRRYTQEKTLMGFELQEEKKPFCIGLDSEDNIFPTATPKVDINRCTASEIVNKHM